jgi:hypothetical protein
MEPAAKKKSSWAMGVIALAIAWVSTCLVSSAAIASSVSVVGPKTRAEVFGRFSSKSVEPLAARPGNATRYYDSLGEVAIECTVAPSSALAGSVRTVNPKFPAKGFDQNCVQCVIATEQRFAGALGTTAKSTKGPLPISKITDEFGGAFEDVSGMVGIGMRLNASGNGARGIVYGADHARGFGHVWNVRYDNGVVRFLDSQPGKRAGLGVGNFDDFTDFKFLLTSPGRP